MLDDNILVSGAEEHTVFIERSSVILVLENFTVISYRYAPDKPMINGEVLIGDKTSAVLKLVGLDDKVDSLDGEEVSDDKVPTVKCLKDELVLKVNLGLDNLSSEGENHFANLKLSNLADAADLKFEAQKAYLTGGVLSDSKGYNELLSLKNESVETGLDIIKPDNYEVVGSPTVSDDGILTNPTTSNYLTTRAVSNINNVTSFSIEARVFNSSTYDNQAKAVFVGKGGTTSFSYVTLLPNNSDMFFIARNRSVDTIYQTTMQNALSYDEWHDIRVQYDNGLLEIYLDDNLLHTKTVDLSAIYFGNLQEIGTNSNNHQGFQGSIDLNSLKISVNGNLIYQPCLKIPYTQSKTGAKIVDVSARGRVQDVYEQYGEALYYTLDENNQNYTIPMGEVYGMVTNNASEITILETEINSVVADVNSIAFTSVNKPILSNGLAVTTQEFDLSDVLPNEPVYCFINAGFHTTQAGYSNLQATSSMLNNAYLEVMGTNNNYKTATCFVIPTNNQKLTFDNTTRSAGITAQYITLYGYQKIKVGG